MKKLFLLLLCLTVFNSCKIPTQLEIKGKPYFNLPVNSDSADMGGFFTENIKKTLTGDGIRVLNYTGPSYPGIQTFLIHYPVIHNYNPGLKEKLDFTNTIDFDLKPEELSQEIETGDLSKINEISAIPVEVDLRPVFNAIRDNIADGFNDHGIATAMIWDDKPGRLDPPVYENCKFDFIGFSEVEFGAGLFNIRITLTEITGNANFYMNGISITGDSGKHRIIGEADGSSLIFMNNNETEKIVVFNLEGQTLENKFVFEIGEIYNLSDTFGGAKLIIQPEVGTAETESFRFRRISGLDVDPDPVTMDEETIKPDFPEDVFVHARIGKGSLSFNFDLPSASGSGTPDPVNDPSYIKGIEISPELHILQGNSKPDADGNIWPGLNSSSLPETQTPLPNPEKWIFSEYPDNLNGKHINTEDIKILGTSVISLIIYKNEAELWLNNEDMENELINISVQPSLDIKIFDVVHANVKNQIPNPDIQRIDLGEAAQYIKTVKFEKGGIGAEIKFSRVDIEGLEMMITEPNLGINPSGLYNTIESNRKLEFFNDNEFTFPLRDNFGNPNEIKFEAGIRPAGGKNIMAFRNMDPSNATFKIEVEYVDFKYDWVEAVIDPGNAGFITGSFPDMENAPMDISHIKDNIPGFEFTDIKAVMYIQGPSAFFDLKPNVVMEARGEDFADSLFDFPPEIFSSEMPDIDPEGTGEFSGTIPPGGIEINNLQAIINTRTTGMRFHYNVSLDDLVITPDIFESDDLDELLNVEILVMIPFKLKSGTTGASIVFPEMFKDKEDLFDRKGSDDSSVLDFINSLSLKLTLTDSLFAEGIFYLNDGIELFNFRLSGNSLGVSITGNQLEYINRTVPYKPEIGIRFEPDKFLQIPRSIGIVSIEFEADISYKIPLR